MEEKLTHQIIGAFYTVFRADHIAEKRVLIESKTGHFRRGRLEADVNYLRSTELEVGLLLYFGPKADYKRFVYSNTRKPDRPNAVKSS